MTESKKRFVYISEIEGDQLMDVIGAQLTSCGADTPNMLKNAGGATQ